VFVIKKLNATGKQRVLKFLTRPGIIDAATQEVRTMRWLREDCKELLKYHGIFRITLQMDVENVSAGVHHAIMMEYVEGDDMATMLGTAMVDAESKRAWQAAARTEDGLRRLKEMAYQIGSQLECLHNKFYVHSDVKPDNIMFDNRKNKWRLVDFGFLRPTYKPVGTPDFMLPQKADAGYLDISADVWAFAVVIYSYVQGEYGLLDGAEYWNPNQLTNALRLRVEELKREFSFPENAGVNEHLVEALVNPSETRAFMLGYTIDGGQLFF
jgi:serine/threonine protein kinase